MKISASAKQFALGSMVISAVLCISACSSNYVISTDDGHMIATHGKPVKDKDTGLISYKDTDGNTHQLKQQDVKEIVEK
ncbi:YgdI/YgdR family lipoprotein [Rahnella sp. PCH160]